MPIKPENKKRYPKNWKSEIRPRVLDRAQNKCDWPGCGVKNHRYILRSKCGDDWVYHDGQLMKVNLFKERHPDCREVYVVLTIAHLDHTPENCEMDNLRAWCQLHHNRYDAKHRAKSRSHK